MGTPPSGAGISNSEVSNSEAAIAGTGVLVRAALAAAQTIKKTQCSSPRADRMTASGAPSRPQSLLRTNVNVRTLVWFLAPEPAFIGRD